MKLELERKSFLVAWQIAERAVNTKNASDALSGILITADDFGNVTLEATDLKTSVKCRAQGVNVLEPGSAVAPVILLGSLLKKLSADIVTIEINSERGFLSSGSNKTRFTVIPVDNFPRIPDSSSAESICEIMVGDLVQLIAEGSSASSAPADFPKYLGTCLLRTTDTFIKSVSTDGKRLSLSQKLCTINKAEDLLLPAPALKDLGKMINSNNDETMIKIFADSSTVWFNRDDVEFSIRRIDANFPAYERILNSEVRTTLKISRDELSSVLDRIDIIAKTTDAHIMAMNLQPNGELRITARAPELGTATEMLQTNIEGGYMQIGFNVGYFQDGLKALGAGDVIIEFSDEEGQCRMLRSEGEDFLYMLMPARLSAQDSMTEEEIGDFSASYRADREAQGAAQTADDMQDNSQPENS